MTSLRYEQSVLDALRRLRTTISERADDLLERIDDPRDTLNYAYELELEQCARARAALVGLPGLLARLELLADELDGVATSLRAQAGETLEHDGDDAALEALARCQVVVNGARGLRDARVDLAREYTEFSSAIERLETKVATFGAAKEALIVDFARSKDARPLRELAEEIAKERKSVQQAIDRCHRMVGETDARTSTIERLIGSGSLSDLHNRASVIEADVAAAKKAPVVLEQLKALKGAS